MKVIVPAYFYPGPIWDTLLQSNAEVVSDVIINPDSGPGDQINEDYAEVVRQCKKRGLGVLGYVATSYGKKRIEGAFQEIDQFFKWYAVDGIFLDEVAAQAEDVTYYLTLYNSIQGKVVLNHGTVPDESYTAAGDVLVIFESGFQAHGAQEFPLWVKKSPRNRKCQIVTACGAKQMMKALRKSAANSGYVYVTDDVEPNPYDVLPSYWGALLKECARMK